MISAGRKIWILLEFWMVMQLEAAVAPPPWADPKLNPCAKEPRGWQLLYWPPDGKCYKIFRVGPPCPEGMELSPAASKTGKGLYAECRCPPKTALYATDAKCHQLFAGGPCDDGHYFAPRGALNNNATTSSQPLGVCEAIPRCGDGNGDALYWPRDGKCYQRHTRGPCPKGQLLTADGRGVAECACDDRGDLARSFRAHDDRCYQHFTKGPCREPGELFLPDKTCGCNDLLPHFHAGTRKCYELGTIGPCSKGEMFTVPPDTSSGACVCRPGNVRYRDGAACYRPYTRGPCPVDHIMINATACAPQRCARGELYYPRDGRCYRVGVRGPCPPGRHVSFDFDARPSVDGVSYAAVCACADPRCGTTAVVRCDKGLIRYGETCHKLYERGPCPEGAWLAPRRQGRELLDDDAEESAICECVPGRERKATARLEFECLSPVSAVADFLNRNFTKLN